MTWTVVPLADVAEVRLGRQRAPKNHFGDSMRAYIRAANVTWAGLDLTDVKTMNFTDAELSIYRMEPGDIILSEASGSPAEVGKPALWSGEIADCAFQNTLIRVRPSAHDPKFLLHFFRYQALDGRFIEHSRGVGIHHLGRARLASWPTPIPAIDEQRRIVDLLEDHLSRLDAAVGEVRSARARLSAMRAGCVDWLLTTVPTTSAPLAEMLESRQGGALIDQGWSPKCIPEPAEEGAWGVLKTTAVQWSEFRPGENKALPNSLRPRPNLVVESGDLLVTRAGPRSRCGVVALVRSTPERLMLCDKMYRVRANRELVSPAVLEASLSSRSMRHAIDALKTGISDSGLNLTQDRFLRLTVEVPKPAFQEEFLQSLSEIASRAASLDDACIRATVRVDQLRRALLAAAFSGRLTDATVGPSAAAEIIGA